MTSRCPVRRVRIGPPRKGLVLDESYLRWIRRQACVCCGTRRYVEAAHVGLRGHGQKCSDYETLPLCAAHHWNGPECHHVLQKEFWTHWNLDRHKLIEELNERYRQEKAV